MKNLNKDITPLLISILLVIFSLVRVLTSNNEFNQTHYIGIGCLIVSIILYFIAKKFYLYFFGLTLVCGLMNLLDFFYITYKVGFAKIGVNPVFILLIVLFFIFSKDLIIEILDEQEIKND